jgi:hypothetical protein
MLGLLQCSMSYRFRRMKTQTSWCFLFCDHQSSIARSTIQIELGATIHRDRQVGRLPYWHMSGDSALSTQYRSEYSEQSWIYFSLNEFRNFTVRKHWKRVHRHRYVNVDRSQLAKVATCCTQVSQIQDWSIKAQTPLQLERKNESELTLCPLPAMREEPSSSVLSGFQLRRLASIAAIVVSWLAYIR